MSWIYYPTVLTIAYIVLSIHYHSLKSYQAITAYHEMMIIIPIKITWVRPNDKMINDAQKKIVFQADFLDDHLLHHVYIPFLKCALYIQVYYTIFIRTFSQTTTVKSNIYSSLLYS